MCSEETLSNEVQNLKVQNQEIKDQKHREVNVWKTKLSTKNNQLNAAQSLNHRLRQIINSC